VEKNLDVKEIPMFNDLISQVRSQIKKIAIITVAVLLGYLDTKRVGKCSRSRINRLQALLYSQVRKRKLWWTYKAYNYNYYT